MHVCSHTENGKPACDPCHNPMNHIKRDSFGKHGQLVNNISNLHFSDNAYNKSKDIIAAFARGFGISSFVGPAVEHL